MAKSNEVVLGRVHSYTLKDLKTKVNEDSGARRISGLANAATVDRGDEFVEPQAFKSSLSKFMENPVVFYNHDWDEPIGTVVGADITSKGLFVEIEIGKGFEPADKVWSQIQQGILKAFSIGFRPLRVEFDEKSEVLTIKDMELFEVSVVTIPMNRESLFEITENRATGVKLMDNGFYVSYKSLVPKSEEKTEDEIVEDKSTEITTYVDDTALKLVTEKLEAVTQEYTDLVVNSAKQLELIEQLTNETNAKHAEEIAQLQAELAEANAKLSAIEKEYTTLRVKNLLQQFNFTDLIKSVL